MADVQAAPSSTPDAVTPKKAAKKEKKTSRPKANHPTTAVMVSSAIKNLKERGGSSLQAIKKYIGATYKVDAEKMAPFIKKYLRSSVASGSLVQTKGKGASGSFKLATQAVTKKPATKSATKAKKPAAKPAPKKAAPKKAAAKKSPAKKKAPEKKKPEPKAAPKSPVKAKKTAKAPTKKPKSPKPKTTKAAKSKKASPKKK